MAHHRLQSEPIIDELQGQEGIGGLLGALSRDEVLRGPGEIVGGLQWIAVALVHGVVPEYVGRLVRRLALFLLRPRHQPKGGDAEDQAHHDDEGKPGLGPQTSRSGGARDAQQPPLVLAN
jgi:hypothetical protein